MCVRHEEFTENLKCMTFEKIERMTKKRCKELILPELRSQEDLNSSETLRKTPSRRSIASNAFKRGSPFLVGGILACFPSILAASEICMPSIELEAALIDWYQERPSEKHPDNIVLWQSDNGKTWTLVQYDEDGMACSLEHGKG